MSVSKEYAILLTMKTYEVTITSKNQITIPADVVKSLKLSRNKVLELTIKDNNIHLTPERDIIKLVKPFWAKHQADKPLTQEQLTQATREVIAKRANC